MVGKPQEKLPRQLIDSTVSFFVVCCLKVSGVWRLGGLRCGGIATTDEQKMRARDFSASLSLVAMRGLMAVLFDSPTH
jgi:hypothetical protein